MQPSEYCSVARVHPGGVCPLGSRSFALRCGLLDNFLCCLELTNIVVVVVEPIGEVSDDLLTEASSAPN